MCYIYKFECKFGETMKKFVTFLVSAVIILLPLKSQEVWEKLNNPYPGAIYSILPVTDNEIYATGNGIYKSTDLGETWVHLDCLGDMKINKLEIDSSGNFYAVTEKNIFRSTDGMQSWIYLKQSKGKTIEEIFVFSNGIIFLSCSDSMFISYNAGETWETIGYNFNYSISKIKNQDILLSIAGDAIYKSTDFGYGWEQIGELETRYTNYNKIIALKDTTEIYIYNGYDLLYIYLDSIGFYNSSYVIHNYNSDPKITCIEIIKNQIFISLYNVYDWDYNIIGIWKIERDSLIKKVLDIPSCIWKINDIKYISDSIALAVGEYGIYKSLDFGENWEIKSNGIQSFTYLDQIHLFNDSEIYINCTDNIFFRSLDSGKSWDMLKFPGSYSIHCFEIDKFGNLFVGAGGNGVWKSTDKGESWIDKTDSLNLSCVTSIGIDSNGVIYALSISGIYKSTDAGESWSEIENNLTGNIHNVFKVGKNNILYGIFYINDYNECSLCYSDDNAGTFTKIEMPWGGYDIFSRYFSIYGDSTIYIYSDSLFQTTNMGKTWIYINNVTNYENYHFLFNDNVGNLLVSICDNDVSSHEEFSGTRLLKYNVNNKVWSDITYNTNNNNFDIDYLVRDQQNRIIMHKGLLYRSTNDINLIPTLQLKTHREIDYDDLRYYDSVFLNIEVRNDIGTIVRNCEVELFDESNNQRIITTTDDNGLFHYTCPITNFNNKYMYFGIKIKNNYYTNEPNQKLTLELGLIETWLPFNRYINDSLYLHVNAKYSIGHDFDYKPIKHTIIYNPLINEYIRTGNEYTFYINNTIDTGKYYFKIWGLEDGWVFINNIDSVHIKNRINDVNDSLLINGLSIFPNPTSSTINLRYRIETAGMINIFLTDVLGSQTLLKSEFKFPGDYVETFRLSEYPQGIYNVVLQTENQIYSEKAILLR